MRIHRLLPALALSLFAGCAHRYPVNAGADRNAVAGLPIEFGAAEREVPSGTTIAWDFGDGTRAEGPRVEHAFARAGEYRVRIEVTDGRGTRSAEARVRVARRPPFAAMPPQVRTAIVFDRLWARLPQQLAVIERFVGTERTRAAVLAAQQILGFDPTRPESLQAAGVDPEEGFALAWMPDDSGLWIVTGVFDEGRASAAVRGALERHREVEFSQGPEGTALARVGSTEILSFARGGYLYVHVSDDDDGARSGLAPMLHAPDEGLFADPAFAAARNRVSGADVIAFARASELPRAAGQQSDFARIREHATSLLVGLTIDERQLGLQGLLTLDDAGRAALGEVVAAPHTLDLARRAPAGAAAYLSLSLNPRVLAESLRQTDAEQLDGALRRAIGFDHSQLLEVLSGDFAVAAYADPAEILAGLVSGDPTAPTVELVAGVGVREGADARSAVEKIATASGAKPVPGAGAVWERDGEEAGAIALAPEGILAGSADLTKRALSTNPEERRLAGALERIVPVAAGASASQLLYVDVASIVDGLRNPPPMEGVDPLRMGLMAAMIAAMFDDPSSEVHMLLPIRDVVMLLHADSLGLAVEGTLRLR